MSLLRKCSLIASSVALSALALTGCSMATQAPPTSPGTPAAGTGSAPKSDEASGDNASGAAKSNDANATSKPQIRAGSHGSEDRVVFEFGAQVTGLKAMKTEVNGEAPAWGGIGEPVRGMTGTSFLHVYVQLNDPKPSTAGPVTFNTPIAKSGVVEDNSEGTAGMTIGLASGVDHEVVIEGNKVIVNMTQGPMGR
jgi:hypothetical protein